MPLDDLHKQVLAYRQEFLSQKKADPSGLRQLIPCVDRHYYMMFRSAWNSKKRELKRMLWIHLPKVHDPGWPKLEPPETIDSLNEKLSNDESLAFDYTAAQFVHRVVMELSENTSPEGFLTTFEKTVSDYNERIASLFGNGAVRESGYPEILYNFEKTHFFDELPSEKVWIFFPLCFRGVWVSILAARVPKSDLPQIGVLLPLLSSTIAEKILTVRAHKNRWQPFGEVRSIGDVIGLLSLAAAQCGLKKWKYSNGAHIFSDECHKNTLRIFDLYSSKGRVFECEDSTIESYFKQVWNELDPSVHSFWARSLANLKLARAAVMSRNFSHNVGSHSLASPRLHESIGITNLDSVFGNPSALRDRCVAIEQRLENFHAYAQGRLDFLARAISESGNRPEPLFFLNDVMEGGFFKQGVLLDTLIQDAGFAAHQIKFRVSIQKAEKSAFCHASYKWNDDRHQFSRSDKSTIEDAVIGIPGGMIGAHALYAFLENVMRNAVKYGGKLRAANGEKKPPKLEIHLRLEQCKGLRQDKADSGWVLSIWDNVSSDPCDMVANDIRRHIKESLLDEETGGMRTQGHGIQEMKLCAELLSGGEHGLRFSADHGYHSDENDPRCAHCEKSCTASREYIRHGKATGEDAIDAPQALRCYSCPHPLNNYESLESVGCDNPSVSEETKWLTYNLFIPIPVLLGVVSKEHAESAECANLPPHVRYSQNVRDLAEHGAQIGVLLDDDSLKVGEIGEILSEIGRLHPSLPFRLMVVTDQDPETGEWGTQLAAKLKKTGEPFKYPEQIPNRRLRICGGEFGRKLKLSLSNPAQQNESTFLGAGGRGQPSWDAIVLRIYDAWLRVFKGEPTPQGLANGTPSRVPIASMKPPTWNLCIGFAHGGEAVAKRWKDRIRAFMADSESCVALHILTKSGESDSKPTKMFSGNWTDAQDASTLSSVLEKEKNAALDQKRFLLFDNHGDCFGVKPWALAFAKGTRFGQKIGIKDGLSLFQSLESPPSSSFGFALFVYQAVEGALTQVAILDERVAQSTIAEDNGKLVSGLYEKRHVLNVAGLFPLYSFVKDGRTPVRLSLRIEKAIDSTPNELWWKPAGEGLHFDGRRVEIDSLIRTGDYENSVKVMVTDVDVLVVHEGVADRLHSERVWDSEDTKFLFGCSPYVVRTSGRGRESRHLKNSLPFLEFTEVSENVYGSLNKVALVKALLGCSGNTHQNKDKQSLL